jgi:DNA-binding LacI/PurR family transcriptional regulator
MAVPTIRDVAKEAGVGVGTVSRVLNNSPQVSPDTRERVLEAIRFLGFRPNKAAQQLSQGTQHRNLGVILPFMTYHSFVERLRGVQTAIDTDGDGYNLVLYSVTGPDRYDEQMESISTQHLVDGLLVISLDISDAQREMLESTTIALVNIGDKPDPLVTCHAPDNVLGGEIATNHLISLGHKRIAFIGDAFPNLYNYPTSEYRYEGYLRAMSQAGLSFNPDYAKFGVHGQNVAQALTKELLALPEPPTAIFAMSDIQALGCIAAARDTGLRVPDDLSVIGFDDIEICQYVGLTTVRQHLEESGRLGMSALLGKLRDEPTLLQGTLPPLKLIVRQTTGPVPTNR